MAKNSISNTIERESFDYQGKTFFQYFVRGTLRGTPVKVQLAPKEKTQKAFEILDIVFGDAKSAEFVITPFELTGENGNLITGNSYAIRTIDEDGEVYEVKVKPYKDTDKDLLRMLLNKTSF